MDKITIVNKYITHHPFQELAIDGKELDISRGVPLLNLKVESSTPTYLLATINGDLVCVSNSENAKKHFAINDDGKGLERGQLTYAIAYSDRQRLSANGSYYRFSDDEAEMLFRDYERWIHPEFDVIIFNDDFFTADVEELRQLAEKLDIHVEKDL